MKDLYLSLRPPVKAVELDGSTLYVRGMTYGELSRSQQMLKDVGEAKAAAVSVLFCACDKDGRRTFGDDDLSLVDQMPVHVVAALTVAAADLYQFSPDPKA